MKVNEKERKGDVNIPGWAAKYKTSRHINSHNSLITQFTEDQPRNSKTIYFWVKTIRNQKGISITR